MSARVWATMICLLPFAFGAAPALAWTGKDLGNWSTSCSNGLTCTLSYQDIDPNMLGTMKFRRTGALSSDTELYLPKPPRFSRNLDPRGEFELSVDGKEVLRLPVRQLAFDPDQEELVSRDRASVQILLEAMKVGSRMRIAYEGVAGSFVRDMALEGFRGSLYFIDDVQGRRGRENALFAVGSKVPEGSDSKDIESVNDIPASIRADFTAEKGSCTEGFMPDDVKRHNGFDIYLSGVRLVLVPCGGGGAYTQPYALYRGYFTGVLNRLSFPDVEDGKPSVSEVAYNVDFDPMTRIMTAFVKDNYLGNCGLWHKWQLTDNGSLLLLEKRYQDDCDSENDGPESFPLEWPLDK